MDTFPINLETKYNLTEEQYRIVEDNLLQVVRVAKAYSDEANATSFLERIQAGNQGLFYAVERGESEPKRLLLFIGYAVKQHIENVGIKND